MKNISFVNSNKSEQLLMLAMSIYTFISILSSTQMREIELWNSIVWVIRVTTVFLVCLSLIYSREISYKFIIYLSIIVIFFVLVAYFSERETEVIINLFFIIGAINIKNGNILKCHFIVSVISILLILLLYFLGIFRYDSLLVGHRPERLFFGFIYTTYLANYFYHILCVYISLKKDTIRLFEIVLIILINYLIYKYTDTRVAYYETILLVIVIMLCKYKYFLNIIDSFIVKKTLIISPFIFSFLSIATTYLYTPNNSFMVRLNSSLSNRLALGKQAIQKYGISLFGVFTNWITGRLGIERVEEYFYVDSSYLNILLSFGLVVFVFLLYGFMRMIEKSLNEKKYYLCIAMVFILLHSMTDPQLFELRYNPFLLFLLHSYNKNTTLPIGNKSRYIIV